LTDAEDVVAATGELKPLDSPRRVAPLDVGDYCQLPAWRSSDVAALGREVRHGLAGWWCEATLRISR
jgi:hypothetical protein